MAKPSGLFRMNIYLFLVTIREPNIGAPLTYGILRKAPNLSRAQDDVHLLSFSEHTTLESIECLGAFDAEGVSLLHLDFLVQELNQYPKTQIRP